MPCTGTSRPGRRLDDWGAQAQFRALLQCAVPHARVASWLRTVCRAVLPRPLIGARRNWRTLSRSIGSLVVSPPVGGVDTEPLAALATTNAPWIRPAGDGRPPLSRLMAGRRLLEKLHRWARIQLLLPLAPRLPPHQALHPGVDAPSAQTESPPRPAPHRSSLYRSSEDEPPSDGSDRAHEVRSSGQPRSLELTSEQMIIRFDMTHGIGKGVVQRVIGQVATATQGRAELCVVNGDHRIHLLLLWRVAFSPHRIVKHLLGWVDPKRIVASGSWDA